MKGILEFSLSDKDFASYPPSAVAFCCVHIAYAYSCGGSTAFYDALIPVLSFDRVYIYLYQAGLNNSFYRFF